MSTSAGNIVRFCIVLMLAVHCLGAQKQRAGELPEDEFKEQASWLHAFHSARKSFSGASRIEWGDVLLLPNQYDLEKEQGGEAFEQLTQMMSAVNSIYEVGKEMTWEGAMNDREGAFKMAAGWWSKPRHPTAPGSSTTSFPATLVTSASHCRLNQVYAQCMRWKGPMSVTIYLALPGDGSGTLGRITREMLRAAILEISQFLNAIQQHSNACQPDVQLVYELYQDVLARRLMYPFNVLRNFARMQARTPLVVMLDVDLLPSKSLYDRLAVAGKAERMMKKATNKTAFIVPAFDIAGQHGKAAYADVLAAGDKATLLEAFRTGVAFPFAYEIYPAGHALTKFNKWQAVQYDYQVAHKPGCEPWIIGDRLTLPWADDRFRGYGQDKIEFVMDLAMRGYTFEVLHDAYIIHRAHQKSEAYLKFMSAKKSKAADMTGKAMDSHNTALYKQMLRYRKDKKIWEPVVNGGIRHALEVLPWWAQARAHNTFKRTRS